MRTILKLLVAMLSMLVMQSAGSRAAALDIFVNNQFGDERQNGVSQKPGSGGGPVRSLTRALELAQAGDRIVVANTGQPYRESLSLVGRRHSGDSQRPFAILGNGATLDGSSVIPARGWEYVAGEVYRFRPRNLTFQQLFIDDRPAVRRPLADGESPIAHLEKREWCLDDGYIYFRVESPKTVYDYSLSCAGEQTGITLYRVRRVVVADLVIQGFHLDGVSAQDGVADCRLVGLTCRGNGRSGIAVAGTAKVEIDGCVVGDNGAAQLFTQELSETRVRDSQLLPRTAPSLVRRGGTVFGVDEPSSDP